MEIEISGKIHISGCTVENSKTKERYAWGMGNSLAAWGGNVGGNMANIKSGSGDPGVRGSCPFPFPVRNGYQMWRFSFYISCPLPPPKRHTRAFSGSVHVNHYVWRPWFAMLLYGPFTPKIFFIGWPTDRMGSYTILYSIHTHQMQKGWRLDLETIESATLTKENI